MSFGVGNFCGRAWTAWAAKSIGHNSLVLTAQHVRMEKGILLLFRDRQILLGKGLLHL